ncbi:MAG: hypothetical protein SNF68_05725 [Rikenellaceae bacterium]
MAVKIEKQGHSVLYINTQEDALLAIKLTDRNDEPLAEGAPFRLHFFDTKVRDKYEMCRTVCESEYYVCAYDGDTYTNCFADEDGNIWAELKKGYPMSSGELYVTQIYTTESVATLDIASVYNTQIVLGRNVTTSLPESGVVVNVSSPIYKGEAGKNAEFNGFATFYLNDDMELVAVMPESSEEYSFDIDDDGVLKFKTE